MKNLSYDIYCYKSLLGMPDLEEAQTVIEVDADNEVLADAEMKSKISKALLDYNPKLENYQFDYEEIARSKGITIDEAKQAFDHIGLNSPEGDFAIQITIFYNCVSIAVPYWYSGDQAAAVFNKIWDYTKVIRQTAGYFVYDPQIEVVFDPLKENKFKHDGYQRMVDKVEEMIGEARPKIHKKPWWKFW